MPKQVASRWMSSWLLAWLALCLLGHAWLAAALGLSVDEAHYALYALHPDWSYFDHPPLVGWLLMPFVCLGGWGVRLVPLALWLLTIGMLWRWRHVFGLWVVVLFVLSPIHHLLGLALVPDALLIPLTILAMVLTLKIDAQPQSLANWCWLGLVLGLAGLSKYTAIFLALGSAIFLLARHGRKLFQAPGLWLAMLIAIALASPVFYWNATHGWASFNYQMAHVGGAQAWQWRHLLGYSVAQILAVGALPVMGLAAALWRAQVLVRGRASPVWPCPAVVGLSLTLGLPLLLLTWVLSGRGASLPHWTAPAWIALLPSCAWGLGQLANQAGQQASRAARPAKRAFALLLGWQALCCMALASALLTNGFGLMPKVGNPLADLYDWQGAGARAQQLRREQKLDVLAVSNWTLASRLAWYARPAPVVALDGKNKQFEEWFGAYTPTQSMLWLNWSQMPQALPNKACRAVESYHGLYSNFDFYACPATPMQP